MSKQEEHTLKQAVAALAEATANAVRDNHAVRSRLRAVLVGTATVHDVVDLLKRLPATMESLAETIHDAVEGIVPDVIRSSDDHLADIRKLFLEPAEKYSLAALAAIWRISIEDVENIYHDQLIEHESQSPPGIPMQVDWAAAMGATRMFNLFRAFDIDRALGEDFSHVFSESLRTTPVLIRIPRFIADSLCEPPDFRVRSLAVRIEQLILELYSSDHNEKYRRAQHSR
jgi:hypothetical protein